MTGLRFFQYAVLAFVMTLLAACQPAEQIIARQVVVEWPEQHLIFIADSRTGQVRSFFLGHVGAPVFLAQTRGVQRSSVRDLQLDAQRGQLWVLGNDGVYVHDARGLALQKRFPLAADEATSLRMEADRVVLKNESGQQLGQINRMTLVASWRIPSRRG